jgi:hypothetical protein
MHSTTSSSKTKVQLPVNAIEDEPPVDLINDLEKLQRATTSSAPDLSNEIGKLAPLLRDGLETTENLQGLAAFQREVKKMAGWAREISVAEPELRDAVLELESILSELYSALRLEARKGQNRLVFFNFPSPNDDDDDMDDDEEDGFETFLAKFSLGIKRIKKLVYPTKATHDQEFLFSAARIRTICHHYSKLM